MIEFSCYMLDLLEEQRDVSKKGKDFMNASKAIWTDQVGDALG